MLRAVRAATHALSIAELAALLGFPANTVRFHVDALEREAAVRRAAPADTARGRGRPALRYEAHTPAPDAQDESLLVDILLADSRSDAEAAGERWGERHAAAHDAHGAATTALVELLRRKRFAPRLGSGGIELHHCPFGRAVAEHGERVCALHLGMMRGALKGWDASEQVTALEPFVEPGVCLARMEVAA